MADPFEVRMRFTNQLQHLNASVTSSQKAAQYALKYRDMDEDLHSCILEQVEKNSMNNRANILYFLEALADLSNTNGHRDYIRMMQRDILRIVDAVAPEDGSGAANIKVVQKVLASFAAKGYLEAQTVGEIDELLQERDSGMPGLEGSGGSPTQLAEGMDVDDGVWEDRRGDAGGVRLDKKLVEQRIEEDRERHKRLREHQWAVPPAVGEEEDEREFEMLFEETSSVGSDDYRLFEEEFLDRKRCAEEHKADMEGTGEA
ncbi:hypothetical protein VE01_06790 [Pseudogymnoascus verrucosus]|uniref:CID domain-containing protein n=1 Tax=Pseudogymnoascus verrucosus TaxID=342668 RepID=A0A1B8GJJ7_9PEZI|nr:uncharacterized protein VE01_06790 [Pseudogymnoascus verrucosus]OBT96017.1 hypothetical protein VE01_06790 [Pseudogymnoascus verrucosus]